MGDCIRDRQRISQCTAKHRVVEDCPDVQRALANDTHPLLQGSEALCVIVGIVLAWLAMPAKVRESFATTRFICSGPGRRIGGDAGDFVLSEHAVRAARAPARMTRLARELHIDAPAQLTEEAVCHGLIERKPGGSCTSSTPSLSPSPRTSSMNWSSTSGRGVSSPSWVSVRGTFTENRKCVGTLDAQRAYV